MGRSDAILYSPGGLYTSVEPTGEVALLGFPNNNYFQGDCYDQQLGNWEINSEWKLNKRYDTIICLRTAYFSKNPKDFIERCYDHLNKNGVLYVDWGLGDHWRFDDYKIGWVKSGKQEYAYGETNYLWSTVWDDSFLKNQQFKIYSKLVKKFGYHDIKRAIYDEVPSVLELEQIKNYFNISYNIFALWEQQPQIYFFIKGEKNG